MTKENALIRVVVEVNHHRAAEVQFLNKARSDYGFLPASLEYTLREFIDKVIEHQCISFNKETELYGANSISIPEPTISDLTASSDASL